MSTASVEPRPVLHLAWTEFQRRQVAMAPLLGFECVFLRRKDTRALPFKGLDYLRLFWQTMLLLRRRRPTVLWLQLPPVPLLWAAVLHRKLFDPGMRIVADAHNAFAQELAGQGRWHEAAPYLATSLRLWPLQRRAWRLFLRCRTARPAGA